jgi:hypothetical protein
MKTVFSVQEQSGLDLIKNASPTTFEALAARMALRSPSGAARRIDDPKSRDILAAVLELRRQGRASSTSIADSIRKCVSEFGDVLSVSEREVLEKRLARILNLDPPIGMRIVASEEDAKAFAGYVRRWDEATAMRSLSDMATVNHYFYRILAMGERAIPLVLREMSLRRRRWFRAMQALAPYGDDPAKDAKTFDEGVDAWLAWGRERGYL